MKAKEARQIAESKLSSDFDKQLNEVMNAIKTASSGGKFGYYCGKVLGNDVNAYLKKLGYTVERKQTGHNEYETLISW